MKLISHTITYVVRNPDLLDVTSGADGLTFHERNPTDQQRWLHKCSHIVGSGVSEKKCASFKDRVELNRLQRGPHTVETAILARRGHLKVEFTITETIPEKEQS